LASDDENRLCILKCSCDAKCSRYTLTDGDDASVEEVLVDERCIVVRSVVEKEGYAGLACSLKVAEW
jgi:hypothetical protein